MNEINEIKIPKGVNSISVTQHDDRVVIEFIAKKKFKNGDFVYEDGRIMIVKSYPNIYHSSVWPTKSDKVHYNGTYGVNFPELTFRYATDEEKQILIDAMTKDGKRWNAEKKRIEDITVRKFQNGDKVVLKSEHKESNGIVYLVYFDRCVGRKITVEGYTDTGYVYFSDCPYIFEEDWLEPWSDEPKKGDLAIFWVNGKSYALIRFYDRKGHEYHYDNSGSPWDNAVKFESKEQFEKILKGEI